MLQDLKDTEQPPSFIPLNLPGWLFQNSDCVLEANKPKQTVIPLAFVAVAVTPSRQMPCVVGSVPISVSSKEEDRNSADVYSFNWG